MNRERFIRQRGNDWYQYEQIIKHLRGTPLRYWRSADVLALSRLYRSICYDLSLVQSREWGAQLEQYLNDLVAQGHNCLYRSPPRSVSVLPGFFLTGFPALLRKRKLAFLLSLSLFTVPLVVSAVVAYLRPDVAEMVAGHETLESAKQNFSEQHWNVVDERYASDRSKMAGFYLKNNAGISFQAFALGVFCGIGSALILVSNGISLGMTAGFVSSLRDETASNFFAFIVSHGAFELPAIVIAGTAGLVLGYGVLCPGSRTRTAALQHHARESLLLALGAGMMLLLAALIEAFFSPLPVARWIRCVVGMCLWAIVLAWLLLARPSGDESSLQIARSDEERPDHEN